MEHVDCQSEHRLLISSPLLDIMVESEDLAPLHLGVMGVELCGVQGCRISRPVYHLEVLYRKLHLGMVTLLQHVNHQLSDYD